MTKKADRTWDFADMRVSLPLLAILLCNTMAHPVSIQWLTMNPASQPLLWLQPKLGLAPSFLLFDCARTMDQFQHSIVSLVHYHSYVGRAWLGH